MINDNSINNNEITHSENLKDVYILAEQDGKIDEITFLCRSLGITPLSYKDHITSLLENEGLAVRQISRKAQKYKSEIKKLDSKCVLLFSDTSSAYANYLARNSYSIVIFSRSLTSSNKSYYNFLASNTSNCGCIITRLHQMFGFTEKLYGNEIFGYLNCGAYDFLKHVYYKIMFGFRNGYAGLPGLYARKVIVPTQEIKDIYLDHSFNDNNVIVTGSFFEDLYSESYKKYNTQYKSNEIDVLFFSQPMYIRSKENWIAEVEALVDDCYSQGLNITILLHPRDDYHYYQHLEGKAKLVSGKRSLSENTQFVLKSKLVVIKSSTTHLIPLVCNVPVAYLNYKCISPFCDIEKSFSHGMILSNDNMLNNVFESVSAHRGKIVKKQREYLKKIGIFDDNSTKRIRELISDNIS
ncbi:alpha-2,8-polysialyltransferase family protein [Amylibacter sp.]|nr:alpha-2,8-polysialyltransferase family protein [Amylibacter sp.]